MLWIPNSKWARRKPERYDPTDENKALIRNRIISFALTFVLYLGLLPMSVLAENALPSDAESQLAYYLDENSLRYKAYQAKNPNIPYEKVVAYVNANVDIGFYKEIEVVEDPNDISVLLNKNFILPSGHSPPDLVTTTSDGKQLRAEAAEAFEAMKAAARDNGFTLVIRSAYRNHWSQVASYNVFLERSGRESADRQSARPGHSEHQLGLAVDLAHKAGTTGPLGATGFSTSQAFYWLLEHGHEYGFILRYQNGLSNIHGFIYEPWHWRYVGVEIATRMRDESITSLEEYYGRYLAPGVIAKMEKARMIQPSLVAVNVDGKSCIMQSYFLDENNYFSIRDVAYILNGTEKQFDLRYDGKITLTSGLPYIPTGMELLNDAVATAPPDAQELEILIDGTLYTFTIYIIDGHNYIKIRDVGGALDFAITWDAMGQTIMIDTQKHA